MEVNGGDGESVLRNHGVIAIDYIETKRNESVINEGGGSDMMSNGYLKIHR